jgi:hypothetical protein
MQPIQEFNPALWKDGTQGHVDTLGRCSNVGQGFHSHRPECVDWRPIYEGTPSKGEK